MQERNLQLQGLHPENRRIQSRYSLITDEGSGVSLLCAAFDGEYASGARGAQGARYMRDCLRAALNRWRCRGLVLDFTRLRYEWGDDMDGVLALNREPPWSYSRLEIMAVTSSLNEDGLRSLVDEMLGEMLGEAPGYLLATGKREAVVKLVRRISKRSWPPPQRRN